MRSVVLPDHTEVPALGQGTWRMGEDPRQREQEITALRTGIDLGMTLIDTAEMDDDGATETLLAQALTGVRDQVFLSVRFYPQNAGRGRFERACGPACSALRPTISISIGCTGMARFRSPRPSRAWRRSSAPEKSGNGASATSTT